MAMVASLNDLGFFGALLQIVMIDIVLSGDNAIVIALACRNLPPRQRRLGILWGCSGAILLRVVLTLLAALVMHMPWLRLLGGLLLFWIAVKLLLPENETGHDVAPADHLWAAVKTIIVADFVMSLDNVIAVAGASHGDFSLLIFGLLLSIPLIVWSSQIILHLMERWPMTVMIGAALLGWVAGKMLISEPMLFAWWSLLPEWSEHFIGAAFALAVVSIGKYLARRRSRGRTG